MNQSTLSFSQLSANTGRMLAGMTLLLVASVLWGYIGNQPVWVTVTPGLQGMSVCTALGLLGIALPLMTFCQASRCHRFMLACLLFSLGVSVAVFVSYVLTGADVLSGIVARDVFGRAPVVDARTSVGTALGIVLVATAQMARLTRRWMLCDALAGLTLLISGMALLGYAYQVDELYALPLFHTMAIHTAASLFFLGLATMLCQAEHGWMSVVTSATRSGRASRRQLVFIIVPPLAGWALLHATRAAAVGPGFALAALVALTVAPMTVVILREGRTSHALDIERDKHGQSLAAKAEEMTRTLEAQAIALRRESAKRAEVEQAMFRTQRLEMIGRLTGGIAHDFNNLLMTLSGNLQVLQRALSEADAHRPYADRALQAIGKGTKLTGQLLAFSRVQKLDVHPMRLHDLLVEVNELLGNVLGSKISVRLAMHDSDAWVHADPDQLELALLNLAVNAREAMPKGGTFALETFNVAMHPEFGDDERTYLSLRISDNGVGMPPDVAARAADPFFTTKAQGEGAGLGLAQVFGVVRQCGGKLHIDSRVGEGTTIELLLPVASAVLSDLPESRVSRTPDSVGPQVKSLEKRLLIVDDDDEVRAALAELFRVSGFTVNEANSGYAALAALVEFAPDAIVLDFMMPGINGAETARLVRKRIPSLPIVFITGYSDSNALNEIAGAVVLKKPVYAATMISAVEDVMKAAA